MLKPRYLAGFTGHRKLDDVAAVKDALDREMAALKGHIESHGGMLELYSSAAYGADVLACQAAAKLGIPVHIILPKPIVIKSEDGEVDTREGFAADFWRGDVFLQEEWDRSYEIIQGADRGENGGTLRLVSGAQSHPECYYDTGLQMLEPIDVLIAVWDRQPARGLGGTQQFVTLAESSQMPRIIIPATGGAAESIGIEGLASKHEKSRKLVSEVDAFSEEFAATSDRSSESTAPEFFARLEKCSGKYSAIFRQSLVRTIQWHGTATLVAAIAAILPQTAFPWKIVLAALAAIELLLVVRAYLLARKLHHDGIHERWMQTRFAAELMRAMMHSAGLLDPLHPLIARHHPQWRRFAITVGLMLARSSAKLPWRTARNSYIQDRLRHPDLRKGQIAYFASKQAEAEPLFKRTLWWGRVFGAAAIVFVIGALLFKLSVITAKTLHVAYPTPVDSETASLLSWLAAFCFGLLPIALPLAAGIFISLRIALDSGRRTYRYKELAERLTSVANTLENLQTEAAVRRTVAATEEVLLDELVEWHLAEQQNGAH